MSKRRILDLVLLAVLAGFVYVYRDPVGKYAKVVVRTFEAPCSSPITYKIGSIDNRFGVSRADFLSAINDAASVWEKAAHRDLFEYSATGGDMPISLAYDYRQKASSQMQNINNSVEASKATYDQMVARLRTMKMQYNQMKTAYESAAASFKTRYDAYQQKVDYWNKKGGAPKSDYDQMKTEEASLKTELAGLNTQGSQLKSLADDINSLVASINDLAKKLNISVDTYNNIGSTLGETFEEGLYQSDGIDKQIDIYEFKDHGQLVRVLAHELGHALDLDHVSDPNAIMYSLNSSTNIVPTAADLAELKAKCKL